MTAFSTGQTTVENSVTISVQIHSYDFPESFSPRLSIAIVIKALLCFCFRIGTRIGLCSSSVMQKKTVMLTLLLTNLKNIFHLNSNQI